MSDLDLLLSEIGRDPGEKLTISTMIDGRFTPTITTVDQAAACVNGHDCWYGTAALHPRVTRGRGYQRDVIGLRELFADLDVKAGGLPSFEAAHGVIDDLSRMIGTRPVAVVSSGGGLQPHWPIERSEGTDWGDETDPRWEAAHVLLSRWGRLVAKVAAMNGGGTDTVSEPARVLRVPGTLNTKYDPPRQVVVDWPSGSPVRLDRLAEALDEYGIYELDTDHPAGTEIVSDPGEWAWATSTCHYVRAMIEAWGSDDPSGRHPWLVSQSVRLAAAHRSGCIAEADYQQGREGLVSRFRYLLTTGQARGEVPGEVPGALRWGRDRAAVLTEAEVSKELGDHEHRELGDLVGDDGAGDEFWDARPVLAHLRTFARSRRVAPWALFGAVLVRLCAVVPPFVVLPPLVGGYGSLNTFIGLVGPSGGGKGAAERAAIEAIDLSHGVEFARATIGSGEGIAHAYMRRPKPTKDYPRPAPEMHTTNVLFSVAEVDTLAALRQRQASTVLPELRKAWSGEQLGFTYADPDKRLPVPAHRYRLALVVGIQPERAGVILDDTDGGSPQRFLWLPTRDPHVPDAAPDDPGTWTGWKLPTWPRGDRPGRAVLPVCPTALGAVDAATVARHRGEGDVLDGHAALARLKVAALLGILDGRAEVSEDDWRLAGLVTARSDAVRAGVQAALDRKQVAANVARGRAEGERSVAAGEVVEDRAIKRVARNLQRKLTEQWQTERDLRHTIAHRDRDYFDDAIAALAAAGIAESDTSGQDRAQWRLAS